MADDGSEDQSETGGSLRSKLESSIAENRQLATELRSFKAAALIAEKGYKFVTADDLKDVSLAEFDAKAAELEAKQAKQEEVILRKVLANQGTYSEAELDSAVTRLLNPEESHAETSTRLQSLARIKGDAPSRHDGENSTGRTLIAEGLAENAAKRPKL